ncbi:MAG: hypothetical protein H6831_11230 [Planctomycetes bacterium]|nr:hypothetical protein [Planctomycetota bacterium]MCB9904971.1 hypothetical protein [Planctomycetota bacterium]
MTDRGSIQGRGWLRAMVGTTCVLLVAALGVRALQPQRVYGPSESEAALRLPEPLQFLLGGASLRVAELDEHVAESRRERWVKMRETVIDLDGCPRLGAWLDTAVGLEFEQLNAELVRGSSEEALAALTLLVALARRTEWDSGFLGGGEDAGRLGGLVAEWLIARSDGSLEDALLYEPALSAVVIYGRAMRTAYQAPTFGRDDAAYARARSTLERLVGITEQKRTNFGAAVQARYGRATSLLEGDGDFLLGFDQEARVSFKDLDGECEE